MKNLFSIFRPVRLWATFILLLVGGVVMAQQQHDCSVHMGSATQIVEKTQNSEWVQERGSQANEKLRVAIYYDSATPSFFGLSQSDWENVAVDNLTKRLDTLMFNTCVYDSYGNIEAIISPLPSYITLPNNIDSVYNRAAITGDLMSLWQGEYDCLGHPHIMVFICAPGTGPSNIRGTATLMDPYQTLQGMIGVAVVKSEQVHMGTYTGAHELAHSCGGAHPNDQMISDPSRKGYGVTSDGKKSLLASPTTPATILEEGDLECTSALNNGVTNMGFWFSQLINNYNTAHPNVLVSTTQSASSVKVDSLFSATAESNWEDVTFTWERNGQQVGEGSTILYVGNIADTSSLVEFTVRATSCSGKTLEKSVSVNVLAPQQTSHTNSIFNEQVSIFPNPAHENITIKGVIPLNVSVFNLLGARLISTTNSNVNISTLPTGNYILVITDKDGNRGSARFSKI